jgi:hypothetical protein
MVQEASELIGDSLEYACTSTMLGYLENTDNLSSSLQKLMMDSLAGDGN